MSQRSGSPSGRRFAEDLRRVRVARNLTIDDLHDETKIPRNLLEEFEESGLFDHPQFNRVYLRSFVRTYVQVLGLPPDVALAALEEALEGRYVNQLAVEFLGEKPQAVPAPDAGAGRTDAPMQAAAAGPAPQPASSRGRPASAAPNGPPETTRASRSEVDWTTTSPPGRRAPVAPPRETPHRRASRSSGVWIAAALGVVALAVVVWLLVRAQQNGDAMPVVRDTGAAADSVLASSIPQEPAAPAVRLGDSLYVRIIAANGKLDPVRVTVDDDLRRPYWVERGDSLLFRPTQRIVIEDRLDRLVLKLEGRPYPTDRRDDQDRVVITRDTALTYLQSLSAPAGTSGSGAGQP